MGELYEMNPDLEKVLKNIELLHDKKQLIVMLNYFAVNFPTELIKMLDSYYEWLGEI